MGGAEFQSAERSWMVANATSSLRYESEVRSTQERRKTTIRLVLVPLDMLSMPQQLAVLVNF